MDVRTERLDEVGVVIIDRGDGRNAVRPRTLSEVRDAVSQLEAEQRVRAIVITSEGRHFSVGADFTFLEELAQTPAAQVRESIYEHFQGAIRSVWACRKPTVAAVEGAAVTVGCELALACDFRIASERAMFQETWIRLGLMPPLGGLFLLPRVVGLAKASEMVLQGREVRAPEALSIGLVNELVSSEALRERALALARSLGRLPPLAYGAVKEALHRGLESSMAAEWQANLSTQALLIGSEDFREGLSAAQEKRSGDFNGR